VRKIIDDKELTVIAKTLLAEITKGLKKQKCLVFTPDNILITEKEIKKKKDFTYEGETQDISQAECLRLFGVILYHLGRGQSEYTHEAYHADPVDAYLNLSFESMLWPVIAALLKGGIETTEQAGNVIEKALTHVKKKKEASGKTGKSSPIVQLDQTRPFNSLDGGIIQLGTGLQALKDFQGACQDNGCKISTWASHIIRRFEFIVTPKPTEINLAVVSVADLGFAGGATRAEIYARAQELGYSLCPPEVGPQLRLQYLNQPKREWLVIGMEPITRTGSDLRLFHVGHDDFDPWLDCNNGCPNLRWDSSDRWVFVRPQPKAFNSQDGGIIQLGTGLRTLEDFQGAFQQKGCKVSDWTSSMINRPEFTVAGQPKTIKLAIVSGTELGFTERTSQKNIYARIIERGYGLCPPEVGPQLRLQYLNQPEEERLFIAMEPIVDSDGDLGVFLVVRDNKGDFWLYCTSGHPDGRWFPEDRWVVVRP